MTALDPAGLRLPDGTLVPLFGGALHYFRISPAHWMPALRALADLGLSLVETPVPWGLHEVAPGQCRFSGPYDLPRFLDLAQEAGLHVVLRPGPAVGADLPWAGLPERLVGAADLCLRNAHGQPALVPLPPRAFAPPSYAAARLYAETAGWYHALAEVVVPRLATSGGPVVGLYVDHELPSFLRTGAHDVDYHDEALAAFRAWQEAQGLAPVAAPRRAPAGIAEPTELLPHLSWLAFQEEQVARTLARLADGLSAAGLSGVPLLHNFPPEEPGAYDVARAETVLAGAGIDMYHRRGEYARVRRRALYLAGTSRLPHVPQLAAGAMCLGPPLSLADSQGTLLCALMHGVRGFNLCMAVERDGWYGAPLSDSGRARPEADFYRRLLAGLRAAGAPALSMDAPTALLLPREYQRLARCATHLSPLSPAWLGLLGWDAEAAGRNERFGLSVPVQIDLPHRRDAILAALARLGRPAVLLDGSCTTPQMMKYRLLIVPTYDFLDRGLSGRLREYVTGGGTLAIGPLLPTRDERFLPCDHGLDGGRVHLLPAAPEHLADALRGIVPPGDGDWGFRAAGAHDGPAADVVTHRDPSGQVRLVGIGNPGEAALPGHLALSGRVRDLASGEAIAADSAVTLPPHGVRLFAVE